jgi:hypothetical protein
MSKDAGGTDAGAGVPLSYAMEMTASAAIERHAVVGVMRFIG